MWEIKLLSQKKMNKSFEILKDIYKPYRYTIKGKAMILETTSGTIVVKPKEKDLRSIYQYLQSRSFTAYPDLLEDNRDGVHVFPYIEEAPIPKEQKAQDMMASIAQLHQKTTYYKPVSQDTYQEIYEAVASNILFLKNYYDGLFDIYFSEVYTSPSHYFLMRNCSKILASLGFAQSELEQWFELVKNEKKQRVCFIHNNLSLEHYFKADQDYFISWEKSKIDSPVLDLVTFYQKEFFDLDFETLFQKYQESFPWNEGEKKLFFILISLPQKVPFTDDEFFNCRKLRECLDYLYKTEELIRPYYAIKQN